MMMHTSINEANGKGKTLDICWKTLNKGLNTYTPITETSSKI